MTNQNGQQKAKENLAAFHYCIAEREAANDWHDYPRGDKLNRSKIAAEFVLPAQRRRSVFVKADVLTLKAIGPAPFFAQGSVEPPAKA